MATKPGFLTDWPWTKLGSFKYVILAPWVMRSVYMYWNAKEAEERDTGSILALPFLLWRTLHNQLWISLSRYHTSKGGTTHRIVDKSLDFQQVDRELNWDDQILLSGLIFYVLNMALERARHLPLWRTDGAIMICLLHAGPVEFLYYWLHRALHHHYLYSRYHSHHHSSIVTEPITSVIHPFGEHIAYFILFSIPILTTLLTGTLSILSMFGYVAFIDLMNNMGHCNFEFIPKKLFTIFPPLKYIMYTPSFHSLHHTQFRTNYCLFMPFYDYVYGTTDKSSDSLYEASIEGKEDGQDVVHLTHLTTLDSIYYLRFGYSSLSSMPHQSPKWYIWFMWPLTWCFMVINSVSNSTFTLERNKFGDLKLQTWMVPRYLMQYLMKGQREAINGLIEKAIVEADAQGTKVFSLGLLNQGEEMNMNGELFIRQNPQLNVKVVDGSSLAAAVVLNSIPKGTAQVLLLGKVSKVANAITSALCQRGIQVAVPYEGEYEMIKHAIKSDKNLMVSKTFSEKVWLIGNGLTEREQLKASEGTMFIPFGQFPPKKMRNDCFYHYTPAMWASPSLENVHSCENWLPRRVISAWRVAGLVHALEGWNQHECGDKILDIEKVWEASLKHGFRPLSTPPN